MRKFEKNGDITECCPAETCPYQNTATTMQLMYISFSIGPPGLPGQHGRDGRDGVSERTGKETMDTVIRAKVNEGE